VPTNFLCNRDELDLLLSSEWREFLEEDAHDLAANLTMEASRHREAANGIVRVEYEPGLVAELGKFAESDLADAKSAECARSFALRLGGLTQTKPSR
jgi:hypothetical protein